MHSSSTTEIQYPVPHTTVYSNNSVIIVYNYVLYMNKRNGQTDCYNIITAEAIMYSVCAFNYK